MKNEGTIERVIQTIIAAALLLGGLFWAKGALSVILILLAIMIAAFAALEFCPLYKLLRINRYKK